MIEANTKDYWRATAALCIGSFMVFANVYLTQPLLPTLAKEFHITALQSSWTFTVTTLTLGLSLLVYGALSDALGRRNIMILTLVAAVLCGIGLSVVRDYTGLLVLRALQGWMLGGLPAIAIAYMGDEFSPRALTLAVGLYIGGNTLGGISGRLIGGFVGDWLGWHGAFVVMTVTSALCVAAFVILLPRSRRFTGRPLNLRAMSGAIFAHLQNPELLTAYLIGGLNFFIFINQYSYITFVLADPPYSLPASMLGMLFLTYLSGTFGSAISGKIADHLPQPRIMGLGILVFICGSLVTLNESLWVIVAGFLLSSFGFFLCHSTASSWVSRRARTAKASASSLYLVFYYLGASTGGFYLHIFWSSRHWPGVVLGSVLVLLVTLGLAIRLDKRAGDAARCDRI
ncbi:MFS transporter [Microbulbifer sp. SAOS-129_SWC]|uniref:MFS transporter n=1 Tax=Microbulbifer sp. SAOS-129_SWC TaxID=3145235 RepID=UPI00321801A0